MEQEDESGRIGASRLASGIEKRHGVRLHSMSFLRGGQNNVTLYLSQMIKGLRVDTKALSNIHGKNQIESSHS